MNKYYKLIHYDQAENGPLQLKNISGVAAGFSMIVTGTPSDTPNLEYSLDGTTWTAYDFANLPTITVPAGGQIYLRGTNTGGFNRNYSNYYSISMDQDYDLIGNLMSLIDYQNMDTITSIASYSFTSLFKNNTHIIHSHQTHCGKLVSIPEQAFRETFKDCTHLETPFDFSSVTTVTSWGACRNMYTGCSSLKYCVDMSNIENVGGIGVFLEMYMNCTSIINGPDMSKMSKTADSLLNGTFKGCTSLVTPPKYSPITWSQQPYTFSNCFNGCTSLLNGIDFRGCGYWTGTFDNRMLQGMYSGCTSLKSASVPPCYTATTSSNFNFGNWLQNVPSGGTLYLPYNITIPMGASGVPSNWTVEYY